MKNVFTWPQICETKNADGPKGVQFLCHGASRPGTRIEPESCDDQVFFEPSKAPSTQPYSVLTFQLHKTR